MSLRRGAGGDRRGRRPRSRGRYRLSATLYVWPGIRVIGYGQRRPALVLGDGAPGYQDPEKPRYLVFVALDAVRTRVPGR